MAPAGGWPSAVRVGDGTQLPCELMVAAPLGNRLRLRGEVFCGTAAGTHSAQVGAYYAGPGNRFWQTLHEIGLTPARLAPTGAGRLIDYGIGLTDIAKNAFGPDHRIGRDAFDAAGLRDKVLKYGPRYLAFNGSNAARAFLGRRPVPGLQSEEIEGTRIFVLPSTSGAARRYWDIAVWRALAAAIRGDRLMPSQST